ncbi:MAG TPA: ABC-2 family transporter protein, partial [Thermoflexales bacterium]|nr:ABC-2 family transporter protein [Thermoflexales bacterium]
MSFLRVLRAFFKVNLQQELAYRADTVVNILLSIMWTIWELLGIAIIFSNTPEIGGWKAADLIALLGVFRLVHTLMAAIVWPNTEEFNKGIREGTLDYVFLLPVNTQAVVSLRRIIVWRVWDILLGIILIAIGLFGARDSLPTIPNILVFIALAISGAAIIYSVWIV